MLTNTHRLSHRVILGWKYVQLGSQWRSRRNFQFREFSWDRKRGSLNVLNRDSWKEAFIWNMLLCFVLLSKILMKCRAVPIHSSFVFADGTQNRTVITCSFWTIPPEPILIALFSWGFVLWVQILLCIFATIYFVLQQDLRNMKQMQYVQYITG